MEGPLITPTNQTSSSQNTPLQMPDTYLNDYLKRIQSSPYLRIIPESKCCPPCQPITYSVSTLSAIDDDFKSNENEAYLFKAILTPICCSICPFMPHDFEMKCYTGSDFSSANDYFCSYRIIGPKCCPPDCSECFKCKCVCMCFTCENEVLIPMTFDIAPSLLEINQDNNEAPYGRVERYRTCCTKLGIRKFYDYGQQEYKYQIGSENCNLSCDCLCGNCGGGCCDCCSIKRFKYKTIKNHDDVECGEYDLVIHPRCLGYCNDISYEIKFPNDATVSMKLLLLGGLFEAITFPYPSVPCSTRIKNI